MSDFAKIAFTDGDGNLQLGSGCRVLVGAQAVLGPRQGGIASPSGQNQGFDEEARAAINSILAVLMAHGLTE